MPTAELYGLEICYQSLGPEEAPACMLVMGLGAQMIVWPDGLVTELLDRGFRVVRFDNRDVGLSSKSSGAVPDITALMAAQEAGEEISAPYTLSDMAADAVGLLDHLQLDQAHVVGASLGGMISQHIAFEFPERVASLTSIMSNTGSPDAGGPSDEALAMLLAPAPIDREASIEHNVAVSRALGGPLFDEQTAREGARERFDRSFTPNAGAFQIAAMGASGDRTERLGDIGCPTLVVHGQLDPLVDVSGGLATAAAVPGADLLILSQMGHDLPRVYWGQLADAVIGIARRADDHDHDPERQ